MEEKDYYSVGSKEDIVVSSSSLQYIDPEQGGSPKAFIEFLESGSEETPAMKTGTLIHLYHEDPDNFKVAEVLKPSEKLGQIADYVIDRIKQGEIYSSSLIQDGIVEVNYYANRWKNIDKLVDEVISATDAYIQEVVTAKENNQVFLTTTQLEPVTEAIEALSAHPKAKGFILNKDCDISNRKVYTELERYGVFTGVVQEDDLETEFQVRYKAKIDKLIIEFDKKEVNVIDLKTTSKGAYIYSENNFGKYKTYRQISFYDLAVRDFLIELGYDPNEFKFNYFITVVETNKTRQCVVYRVSKKWIAKGTSEIKTLIARIAWHKRTGNWSYSSEEVANDYIIPLPYVELS